MATTIHERARGRWEEVFREVLQLNDTHFSGKHMPCPACGGADRFRLKRGDPKGAFFCGSDRGTGIDLVMHVLELDFASACRRVEDVVGRDEQPREREVKPSDRIASRARTLRQSAYLAGRGLEVPGGLQCIDSLDYFEGSERVGEFPAILAPIMVRGRFAAYQAIYVSGGQKAPVASPKKMIPGRPIAGGAVQLYPLGQSDSVLGVAEGVETSIAAHMIFGVPVWATLSTSGMGAFDPPASVKELVIFADNDRNHAGHAAAYKLAHRMAMKGLQVRIEFPATPGTDWNDVLITRGEKHA